VAAAEQENTRDLSLPINDPLSDFANRRRCVDRSCRPECVVSKTMSQRLKMPNEETSVDTEALF
jgi:hypothetical protein